MPMLLIRFLPYILPAIVAAMLGWKAAAMWYEGEIDDAVQTARAEEIAACTKAQAITQGVADATQTKLDAIHARYADALGRLYDATHSAAPTTGNAKPSDETATDHRLYYADPSAARAALDRARIASEQAEQLVGCQAFLRAERESN